MSRTKRINGLLSGFDFDPSARKDSQSIISFPKNEETSVKKPVSSSLNYILHPSDDYNNNNESIEKFEDELDEDGNIVINSNYCYNTDQVRITHEDIRTMMSADEIFRGRNGKGVGWPLLNEKEIYGTMLYYADTHIDSDSPTCGEMNYSRRIHTLDSHIRTPQGAKSYLAENFPILDEILRIDPDHIIVAGGSVCTSLVDSGYYTGQMDVDIFFIGLGSDDGEIAANIITMAALVIEQDMLQHEDSRNLHICRSQNTTTFQFYSTTLQKIQFIHRLYPDKGDFMTNISMPIGGFDLHSCACAYFIGQDGEGHFAATPACAWTLATGVNVLMTSRASTSMAVRLNKYMRRGFRVYLPGITTHAAVRTSEATFTAYIRDREIRSIELPFMRLTDYHISGKYKDISDYGAISVEGSPDGYLVERMNIQAVLTGKLDQFAFVSKSWRESLTCCNDFAPKTTQEGLYIKESWWREENILLERVLRDVDDELQSAHNFMVYTRGNHSKTQQKYFSMFEKYFSCVVSKWILEKVDANDFSDYSDVQEVQNFLSLQERYASMEKGKDKDIVERQMIGAQRVFNEFVKEETYAFAKSLVYKANNYFKRVLKRIREEARKIYIVQKVTCLEKLKGHIEFITINPLRQHTASCNPTIVDPRSWWGENNYRQFEVGFPNGIFILLKYVFTKGVGKMIGYSIFRDVLLPHFAKAWANGVVDNWKKTFMPEINHLAQEHYKVQVAKARSADEIPNIPKINGIALKPVILRGRRQIPIRAGPTHALIANLIDQANPLIQNLPVVNTLPTIGDISSDEESEEESLTRGQI